MIDELDDEAAFVVGNLGCRESWDEVGGDSLRSDGFQEGLFEEERRRGGRKGAEEVSSNSNETCPVREQVQS